MNREIEEYYNKYGQKVYAYLLSICCEPDTAQDLTQETFCQAIKSLSRFKGECSVCTWLCRIAKFLWLKEIKRRKYHPSSQKEPDLNELDINVIPPDDQIENYDTKMYIIRQIHELPEREKEIILLKATGALTFEEIGQLFGKSASWARVTYYRAKQKLRKE
ncbi:sigma-70 family RNA polymerase sigma factor [Ruminococcus sp.]|uniref:RNA polymerase sigma factor n=1 Tax=Ruminococcus sp. TaxID=41978 RepID=UPI0025EFEF66|nr:sigma-70 family RNA polymerase sigma factor [Ruminococcus sp.]MBQ6252683.1 sigma-70 family RNA polymerase sigma factor [Ruminococcus sp.]MBR0511811.1 sigma-70 family RNA polymerase sigma factor [Ruminococcus sp.]MBR6995779.1 sigma-70 family RNA polymerase sigma factor [Ruminococcus sp.]